MHYNVVEARFVRDFVIWLRFRDGTTGEVDLKDELYGRLFGPLREPSLFRQFRVDPEFETLVWPNGADLAPEFLYERAKVAA